MTERKEDACKATRAVEVVYAGTSLQADAAVLTQDVNQAYYLVHQTVRRALAEPGCAEVSADALSREMSDRFDGGADDPTDAG